jgi:hypothetical protein
MERVRFDRSERHLTEIFRGHSEFRLKTKNRV